MCKRDLYAPLLKFVTKDLKFFKRLFRPFCRYLIRSGKMRKDSLNLDARKSGNRINDLNIIFYRLKSNAPHSGIDFNMNLCLLSKTH